MNERRTSEGNSTYPKVAVQWLIEHFTSNLQLWCMDSLVIRIPPPTVGAKR